MLWKVIKSGGPIAPSSYANGTRNYKQWYCRHWTGCQLVGFMWSKLPQTSILDFLIFQNLFVTCPRPPSFRIVLHTMSLTQMIIWVRPGSGPDVTWFAEIEACDDIYILGMTIWSCAVLAWSANLFEGILFLFREFWRPRPVIFS